MPDPMPEGTAREAKFSRLREGQDILVTQIDPAVPVVIKKAKVRGHHGIETRGAKVDYTEHTGGQK